MHGHGEYIWSDGLKYKVCKKLTQVTKLCFIFMYILTSHIIPQCFLFTLLPIMTKIPSCCIWQGGFKLNVPMGHGTYTWLDGSTYEGEVHKGVRHGVGVYTCAKTSTVYRGQWYLGKRQGQVCMYLHTSIVSIFRICV